MRVRLRARVSNSAAAILLVAAVAVSAGTQVQTDNCPWILQQFYLRWHGRIPPKICGPEGLEMHGQITQRPDINSISDIHTAIEYYVKLTKTLEEPEDNQEIAGAVKAGLELEFPAESKSLHFTFIVWTVMPNEPEAVLFTSVEAKCQQAKVPAVCFNNPGGVQSLAAIPLAVGQKRYAVFWDQEQPEEAAKKVSPLLAGLADHKRNCIRTWLEDNSIHGGPGLEAQLRSQKTFRSFGSCLFRSITIREFGREPVATLVVPGSLKAALVSRGEIYIETGPSAEAAQAVAAIQIQNGRYVKRVLLPPGLLLAVMF